MKVAIMQPYIFPYLGYFQLINAVDTFIFYDDVNYIKRGWINRNQILMNNEAKLFTIPVLKASQNKLINEIEIRIEDKWRNQFYSTIEQNYKRAPFFKIIFSIIQQTIESTNTTIGDLSINSIEQVTNYLGLERVFEKSSKVYFSTKGMEKADRLIEICKVNQAKTYINPIGGKELYKKETFKEQSIDLLFLENQLPPYPQFKNDFIPGLSIIDVLMFNSKEDTLKMLDLYKLI